MGSITGIWEQLEDSGCKPILVLDCEQTERDIILAHRKLNKLVLQQSKEYLQAKNRILETWSPKDLHLAEIKRNNKKGGVKLWR